MNGIYFVGDPLTHLCKQANIRIIGRHISHYDYHSDPAKFGKRQGAKESGHNLAREQPKFGHNLVRKRHKIGHTFTRERPKFGLVGD